MDATFKSSFWTDEVVAEWPREIKLGYVWCWTNPARTITGCIPKNARRFAFETGLEASWFETMLTTLADKLVVIDGTVWVKNWMRVQFGNRLRNPADNVTRRLKVDVGHYKGLLREVIYREYPELRVPFDQTKGLRSHLEGASEGLKDDKQRELSEYLPHQPESNFISPQNGEGTTERLERGYEGTRAEPSRDIAKPSHVGGGGGFPKGAELKPPTVEEMLAGVASKGVGRDLVERYVEWVGDDEMGAGWIVKGKLRNWRFELVNIWKRKEDREGPPKNKNKPALDLVAERDSLKAEFQSAVRAGWTPEILREKQTRLAELNQLVGVA